MWSVVQAAGRKMLRQGLLVRNASLHTNGCWWHMGKSNVAPGKACRISHVSSVWHRQSRLKLTWPSIVLEYRIFCSRWGGGVNHDLLAKGQRLYEQCPALWLRGVPLLPEGYVAPDTYQWHSPMIADVVRSQQMQM